MTKFLLGTIATLLLTLSFFIYKHNKTLQDLEHEKYKNLSLESKLQDSNKALEKIQLDTQSYLKARDKEIQQIQNKYTKLLQEHTRKVANIQKAYESKLSLSVNAVSKENLHIKYISGLMPSNHDNKFFSSQVKLDNSHNATDTSKKSVGKHSLHTQNRDVSGLSPQHDNSHNLSYSEFPNNSNSSFQNENTCMLSLQHCQLQIQTAKALLQRFIK